MTAFCRLGFDPVRSRVSGGQGYRQSPVPRAEDEGGSGGCAVEADGCRRGDVGERPLVTADFVRAARIDRERVFELDPAQLLGESLYVGASAPPTGTVESKITRANSGRTARLRECRALASDTQRKCVYLSTAYQTGEAQGRRSRPQSRA